MWFYLDENLSPRIAALGRSRSLDIISSHECGRNQLPDDEQLRLAAEEGRCFVTRDDKDLIPLTVRFFQTQQRHAGLLIVPNSFSDQERGAIADALVSYTAAHPEGLPSYTIDYLRRAPGDNPPERREA